MDWGRSTVLGGCCFLALPSLHTHEQSECVQKISTYTFARVYTQILHLHERNESSHVQKRTDNAARSECSCAHKPICTHTHIQQFVYAKCALHVLKTTYTHTRIFAYVYQDLLLVDTHKNTHTPKTPRLGLIILCGFFFFDDFFFVDFFDWLNDFDDFACACSFVDVCVCFFSY